ncbi:hypothetical protein A2U01_0034640, partial [Trifolium medium]|nr:hypothetical protein [Trifolium medium]
MSQNTDSTQFKNDSAEVVKTRSKSKKETPTVIVDAKPISIVPPTDSKKKSTKSKASEKKEKPTKVSESSPSVTSKYVSGKPKKKKGEPSVKKSLTMFDLYMSENPFGTGNVESHVDTSVKTVIKPNVESSGKVSSEIVGPNIERTMKENPISENPKSGETLDEYRTVAETIIDQTSLIVPVVTPDKAIPEPVNDSMKE